jgi:hypothetical protein
MQDAESVAPTTASLEAVRTILQRTIALAQPAWLNASWQEKLDEVEAKIAALNDGTGCP